MAFLIGGANSAADTAYSVANSCRFNDGDSPMMQLTPGSSATSSRIMTISFWCKRSGPSDQNLRIICADTSGSNDQRDCLLFTGNKLNLFIDNTDDGHLKTNRLFRDAAAWYHIVVAIDTTQGTAANRVKIYVNGVQETSFETSGTGVVYPDQNYDILGFGQNGREMTIGADTDGGGNDDEYDGYLAEFVFIDGQQLAPTSFGEFDEDSPTIWKPIDVSELTFGTKGFYLDFEDSANLGNDANGGADFTETNLAAADQATYTPTNNFCTLNPLTIVAGASLTLAEGNLEVHGSSTDAGAKGTMGVAAGKWYWEIKCVVAGDSGSDRLLVATENVRQITSATDPNSQGIWGIQNRSGTGATLNSYTNGTFSNVNTGSTGFANNTIIGVAYDADNGKLYFAKDNTYTDLGGNTGDPPNATNPTFTGLPTDGTFMLPYVENRVSSGTPSSSVNFGGCSSFALSSAAADENGYGNFEFAPPSGFLALCTKNLGSTGG